MNPGSLEPPVITEAQAARFWERVERSDGCWLWTGPTNPQGYGYIKPGRTRRRKVIRTHRAAWVLTYGPIPNGLHVCHTCDNPRCVNPSHLWLGSNADNVRDKIAKGRMRNGRADQTHCRHGHEFAKENIYWARKPDGGQVRRCRMCARIRDRIRGPLRRESKRLSRIARRAKKCGKLS